MFTHANEKASAKHAGVGEGGGVGRGGFASETSKIKKTFLLSTYIAKSISVDLLCICDRHRRPSILRISSGGPQVSLDTSPLSVTFSAVHALQVVS